MQSNQLTTVEEFIFIYEHNISPRLKNILKVFTKSIPNYPVEDVHKDVFLCLPNAGNAMWKEFVHLVALMKIEEAEQRKTDIDLGA